jgi:glycyl-tRNA synthetase beta chain
MAELVFEIGCEELPATFVLDALSNLANRIRTELEVNSIPAASIATFATPRRLIVVADGVAEQQADSQKEMRGPAIKAAFDPEGNASPALLGFCRSQGVDVETVRKDDQYVWVTKHIPGRPTPDLLATLLPTCISELSFPKSMRWGSSRLRFARPIRWIVARFAGQTIPFSVETVTSGSESRGHRFYAPEAFPVTDAASLLEGLRSRYVEPDSAVREKMILDQISTVCSGIAEVEPELLQENVQLTEWPTVIEGEFPEHMLNLPEPVLVTAMAKHERMFPVRTADGRLTNRFLFVRNNGEDDTVRKGCAWVLNARFNDAQFFFEEDRKSTLSDFLERTRTIVFQERLGSVRSRADRISALSRFVAECMGASDDESQLAVRAGLYAKADLATGLVSELSSLQGVIGAEYALREEFAPEIVTALRHQYSPNLNVNLATDAGHRTGARLAIADQLDKLAGYLGLGLEPTGSSDPFGLRRSVTILIDIANAWPAALPAYDQLFDFALSLYREQGIPLDDAAAHVALWDIFEGRYRALRSDVRHSILEAAMLTEHRWEVAAPQQVAFRIGLMTHYADKPQVVQTATRPLNLVASAKKKGVGYGFEDPLRQLIVADLDSESGKQLRDVLAANEDRLHRTVRERDAASTLELLNAILDPINKFLDGTMIMVEDEKVRFARLTLLHAACLQLLMAGDFTKIVMEG